MKEKNQQIWAVAGTWESPEWINPASPSSKTVRRTNVLQFFIATHKDEAIWKYLRHVHAKVNLASDSGCPFTTKYFTIDVFAIVAAPVPNEVEE